MDYSTSSKNMINTGVYYNNALKLHYKGLFVNNMCDHYGMFTINDKMIYIGELKNGIPYGKGTVYSQYNGNILFIGTILDGMPKYGVCFSMPTIYEGFFYFNYSYQQERRSSLFRNSPSIFEQEEDSKIEHNKSFFNFDSKFNNFEIDGHVINFNKYILEVDGKLTSNNKSLNGMMRIIDKNRSIYHGQ